MVPQVLVKMKVRITDFVVLRKKAFIYDDQTVVLNTEIN